jgi:hypothetical protein
MRLTRRSFDALPVLADIREHRAVTKKEKRTGGRRWRTCELQDFGREIFEDSRSIHGRFRADTDIILRALFQVSVNTANGELLKMNASDNDQRPCKT